MADAIETPAAWNQVFNIGADTPSTLNDLARRVASAMGVPQQVVHLPARHEVRHMHASHECLTRVFGERQKTPLDEGLARMAAWVRAHGARRGSAFQAIEISKNLPASWATPVTNDRSG